MNSVIPNNLLCKPDFVLEYSEEELEQLSNELSAEDEKIFEEILKLEEENKGNSDFMKELLEAAKKGTMQYLDAMTDTGETFNKVKRPDDVKKFDNEKIIKHTHSADPNEKREYRTMQEAGCDIFDRNVPGTTSGMSEKGARLFAIHKEAYSQRTKSVTGISNENNSVNYKSDSNVNSESLSGLRGYAIGIKERRFCGVRICRVGSPVPMYSVDEIQEMYARQIDEKGVVDNPSNWIMQENYNKFKDALIEKYGFKSRDQADRWMKDNHLTIHEAPDGMYLIPTDVHDAVKHSGYRSKMTALLKGQITKEELNTYIVEEKVKFAKHEVQVRGVRAAKGIALSAIKDVLKCTIVVICEETYSEFKIKSEDKFIDRMLRIFKNCWEKVKSKCKQIINNIWSNIQGSLLSELLTALNDFFFGTFKNIFKIIRQMFGSIKSAFKIICSRDKKVSWGERFFEASKILSAGIVGIIGFSLNELIEKGLTSIGIPFASFIAECLSGLFAGIMSAIVMMLFDKLKKQFISQSTATRQLQLESRYLCIHSAQVDISSLIMDMKMLDTYNFIGQIFASMNDIYKHIESEKQNGEKLTRVLVGEAIAQKERNADLEALKRKYIEDTNF